MAYTKEQLERVKQSLLAKLDQLKQEESRMAKRASEKDETDDAGELSDYDPEHPGDLGTATFEREKDLALLQNLSEIENAVRRALEKVDEGTYGLCDRCGVAIRSDRMKALPYATLCVQCQEIVESR